MLQVARATIEDFVSFLSTVEGSFFIRHLCKVLQDHGHEKTLADMMTIVNNKVGQCIIDIQAYYLYLKFTTNVFVSLNCYFGVVGCWS